MTENISILLMAFMAAVGCGDNEEPTLTPPAGGGEIEVYVTSLDGSSGLVKLASNLDYTEEPGSGTALEIGRTDGPPVDGFGAALTGSSAYLLSNRPEVVRDLFAPDKLGLSYVRLTMGASDFTRIGNYTYNDISEAEDTDLSFFTIEKDKLSDNPVIPVMHDIVQVNPDVSVMASPWTAPAWMKTSKSYIGGSLLPQYYEAYAGYFVKYIEAYAAEGITIDAITAQNEPLHEPSSYPGMLMSATEQAEFIGSHLGPGLAENGLDTDIIGYDHNFYVADDPDYPLQLLRDAEASDYVKGIGYHAYGGRASDIDPLLREFPDKEIHFTEQSGIIGSQTSFRAEIIWFMQNVFAPMLRRGARSILLWNLALDENNGPTNGGCETCRGVVTVTSSGNVIKNPEYYLLGHFSKFVKPGARVLDTPEPQASLQHVAFENTDGSRALILLNTSTSQSKDMVITTGGKTFQYTLPANALVTLTWPSN